VGVDADKHAGACDLSGIKDDRSFLEGRERCLDLADPLVDPVGQFVSVRVLLLEAVKLGLQGGTARTLLIGEVDGFAVELSQARGVAIRKIGSNRDPLPALCPKG